MSNKSYYEVTLKDGRVLDFDKKCDTIDFAHDEKYVLMKQTLDDFSYILLGIIELDEILMIVTR